MKGHTYRDLESMSILELAEYVNSTALSERERLKYATALFAKLPNLTLAWWSTKYTSVERAIIKKAASFDVTLGLMPERASHQFPVLNSAGLHLAWDNTAPGDIKDWEENRV